MTAAAQDERLIPRLTGQIHLYIFERFCRDLDFRFGSDKFRLAYDEEVPDFVDEDAIVIVRESDGKRFETEIHVLVRELTGQVTP